MSFVSSLVYAVSSGDHVTPVQQSPSALEARDADVRLPGELAEVDLVSADDATLQGHDRLTADWKDTVTYA